MVIMRESSDDGTTTSPKKSAMHSPARGAFRRDDSMTRVSLDREPTWEYARSVSSCSTDSSKTPAPHMAFVSDVSSGVPSAPSTDLHGRQGTAQDAAGCGWPGSDPTEQDLEGQRKVALVEAHALRAGRVLPVAQRMVDSLASVEERVRTHTRSYGVLSHHYCAAHAHSLTPIC